MTKIRFCDVQGKVSDVENLQTLSALVFWLAKLLMFILLMLNNINISMTNILVCCLQEFAVYINKLLGIFLNSHPLIILNILYLLCSFYFPLQPVLSRRHVKCSLTHNFENFVLKLTSIWRVVNLFSELRGNWKQKACPARFFRKPSLAVWVCSLIRNRLWCVWFVGVVECVLFLWQIIITITFYRPLYLRSKVNARKQTNIKYISFRIGGKNSNNRFGIDSAVVVYSTVGSDGTFSRGVLGMLPVSNDGAFYMLWCVLGGMTVSNDGPFYVLWCVLGGGTSPMFVQSNHRSVGDVVSITLATFNF